MTQFEGIFETTLIYVIDFNINHCCNEEVISTIYETRTYSTDIEYSLCPNDDDSNICLKFTTLKGNKYSFEIKYFSEHNFEIFYKLLYKRFCDKTDSFGKINETFDGKTSTITKHLSVKNAVNSIIYALKEMFLCIRQIIETHKQNTSSYCLLQNSPEDSCNYEEYIHNVACKVIIQSNYYLETLSIELENIDFINTPREFCSFLLEN